MVGGGGGVSEVNEQGEQGEHALQFQAPVFVVGAELSGIALLLLAIACCYYCPALVHMSDDRAKCALPLHQTQRQ